MSRDRSKPQESDDPNEHFSFDESGALYLPHIERFAVVRVVDYGLVALSLQPQGQPADRFQCSLTPDQARSLGQALASSADRLEAEAN